MRCRLVTSWSGSTFQGLGCSPIKVVHEMGSERRKLLATSQSDLRVKIASYRGNLCSNCTLKQKNSCRAIPREVGFFQKQKNINSPFSYIYMLILTNKQQCIKNKWKTKCVKISSKLRDIINGYIMSDGYINPYGSLQIKQYKALQNPKGSDAHFVEWLYHELEPIRTQKPIANVNQTRNGVKNHSRRFFTRSVLNGFRFMWYKPYVNEKGVLQWRKSLPKSLACFFSPTFITLWFAGDGTKTIGHKGAKFEVTAFEPSERRILQKLFHQKFNISARIIRSGQTKKGKQQWAIVIGAAEYSKFRELITQMDLIPRYLPHKLHKIK